MLIAFFVRALQKLLAEDETNGASRRQRYQSLDSTNGDSSGELAKHVFFDIPFSGRHVVTEDKFKIGIKNSPISHHKLCSNLLKKCNICRL